jgi:hypothetical protein
MGVFNVLCLAFAPSWWPSTYPFCRVFAKTKYFFLIYLFILVRVPELSKLGVGSTFGLVFFSWGLGWGKGLWGLKTIDPIQWHSWRYLRCFYSGIKSFMQWAFLIGLSSKSFDKFGDFPIQKYSLQTSKSQYLATCI